MLEVTRKMSHLKPKFALFLLVACMFVLPIVSAYDLLLSENFTGASIPTGWSCVGAGTCAMQNDHLNITGRAGLCTNLVNFSAYEYLIISWTDRDPNNALNRGMRIGMDNNTEATGNDYFAYRDNGASLRAVGGASTITGGSNAGTNTAWIEINVTLNLTSGNITMLTPEILSIIAPHDVASNNTFCLQTRDSPAYPQFDNLTILGQLRGALSSTLSTPTNNSVALVNESITFIANLTDTTNLKNATLYIDYVLNETKDYTGTSNQTNFSGIKFGAVANHSWFIRACNDADACINSSIFNLTIDSLRINSATYNSTAIEGSQEQFIANISLATGQTLSNAYLIYNGTSYPSTITGTSSNPILTNTLSIPQVAGTTINNFYWEINLVSGQMNTSTYSQTINDLNSWIIATNCPAGTSPAMNFTFGIESNLSEINASTVNYVFSYGLENNTISTINSSLSNVAGFSICINNSNTYYNVGYGQIDYEQTGYEKRSFYIFNNQRITNVTISNVLYLLDTTSSTPVLVTAQSTSLTPYSNNYMALLRFYPAINSYKVVDMAKTDDKGQGVLKVKTTDVDYRIGIYNVNGTLIKLINPIRMVCLTTPCTYSIFIEDTGIDMSNFLNVQQSLTFDNTTKIFTYAWNDASQSTTMINLSVTKMAGDSETVICSTSASSFTGILTCDISAYSGTFKAQVYRSASPPVAIAQLIVSTVSTLIDIAGGSTISLVIGLIFVALLALVGLYNPVVAVIMAILGMIPMFLLGGITWVVFAGIIVLGFIIIHFLRRSSS